MIIGNDIHVEPSEFKGKKYVMIRKFYDDNGIQKPGKNGINMTYEEWQEFCVNFENIKKEIG
jgi:hypothetical protein